MTILETDLVFKHPVAQRPSTTRIVVHHTAAPATQDVQDIHGAHLARGWSGIGYNVVQAPDGKWYEGRGLDKQGAHATGYNRNAIGIALTGNFETDRLTVERWTSLVQMCVYLCDRYSLDYTDVVGHRELPGAATLCPGQNLHLPRLREAVHQRLVAKPRPEIYRVIVDGGQVGAYQRPLGAVIEALSGKPDKIVIEKT